MSSEISTDHGFRPWHFFVLTSILLATVAVILARPSTPEHLVLLSFTIAAAGAAAGALYRTLAPLGAPFVTRQGTTVSERTRAALERDKALVLRSIKELEFDRSMGKLSHKDFEEMGGRLRARALMLMKQLDAGTADYTSVIEAELTRRIRTAPSEAAPAPHACGCGTTNDADAVFCKQCGQRIHA